MKAIKTQYRGPTNTKGSRIIATAEGGHRLVLPYDQGFDVAGNHHAVAMALVQKLRWFDVGSYRLETGSLSDCYVHVIVFEKVRS